MERSTEFEEPGSEEAFVELFGKAQPRPVPPAADEALIRDAVHAEWRRVAGRKVRRRQIASFALAASVLLAVIATFDLVTGPAGDIADKPMAAVEKQFGEISINSRQAHAGQIAAIDGGDVVETGPGSGLALAWHDGGSLRIDENTSVEFEARDRIYLRGGRIYFDSEGSSLAPPPASSRAARLAIRTDHGVVRHLGTQYMTQVGTDVLVISVREGMVAIDGNVTARASAGQQFSISRSGELSITDTNGVDNWEWIEKSSPFVNLDGRLVSEALDWVSRESGRTVHYANASAERVAKQSRLRGNVELPPSRALEIFMMTTDLTARIEGQVIIVSEE